MTSVFPSNASHHLCTRVVEGLLRTISGATIIHSDRGSQDLVKVLERTLSITSLSTTSSGCQFCPLAPEIIRIADNIQMKLKLMMEDPDHVILRTIRQLTAIRAREDLSNDCCALKELLQSIMDRIESDSTNSSFSPLSASMLDGAHDLRIDGANFTSIAVNSIRSSSSNVVVFVKQESGISCCSMLILVLLSFLFLYLLR